MAVLPTATTLASSLQLNAVNRDVSSMLDSAVADAVADVEGYLGRAIMPRQYTEHNRPAMYGGYDLTPLDQPVLSLDTIAAELFDPDDPTSLTGLYTVTYTAGIDCTEPDKAPIVRYVKAAALNAPEVVRYWQANSGLKGPVVNVTTDGQAISYAALQMGGGGNPGSLSPGALPTLKSLDRWRLAGRRVFQRRGELDQWPYGGLPWGSSW